MQPQSFPASLPPSSTEQCPAFGLEQLDEMMKIADPVSFGSFELLIDPTELFELAFSKQYDKFVTNLNALTKQSLSNVFISEWTDLTLHSNSENISSFKHRTVKICRRNASPWSWMNNRLVESVSQQYSIHRPKGWTVYCVSQGCEKRATRVIEKFEVEVLSELKRDKSPLSPRRSSEPQQTPKPRVRVGVSASAHYSDGFAPSFVAFTKATSSCRFQYGKWKQLILEMVNGTSDASEIHTGSPLELAGKWNKLNSYDRIELIPQENRLVHFDGHSFPFNITKQHEDMTVVSARYGDRVYVGTIRHDVPDEIKWDNGSVWIKEGFTSLVGVYDVDNKQMEFLDTGEVICSDGDRFHVVLCGRNEIERASNGRLRHFAEHVDGRLIWNTDEVWVKHQQSTDTEIESKTDDTKVEEEVLAPKTNVVVKPTTPKVPVIPAPPVPAQVQQNPPPKVERGNSSEEEMECEVTPVIGTVIEQSDDDEPSGSASYSMSVEKILHYDLEKAEEFEGWLLVDECF